MAQNGEPLNEFLDEAELIRQITAARQGFRALIGDMTEAAAAGKRIEIQIQGASTVKEVTAGTNALVDAQGRLINATRDIARTYAEAEQTVARFNGHSKEVVQVDNLIIKGKGEQAKATRELLAADEQAFKTRIAQLRLEKLERDKAAAEEKTALAARKAQEKEYSDWWIAELKKRDAAAASGPSAAIVAGRAKEGPLAGDAAAVTSGSVVTAEETAALQAQQSVMADLNTTQNTRAQLVRETAAATAEENAQDDIQIATITLYRQYVKELTAERNELNLMTAQGTVRQAELNAEIDMYNSLIKENVDAYQKQKINIGNYPTLSAELKDVRLQMERLVAAGEKDSAAFQELSVRAQQLTSQMAEVRTATQQTASTAEVLQGKLEKAFSLEAIGARFITSIARMGLHLLIFTIGFEAAAKIAEFFGQKMKENEEGITAYDKELERSTAAIDKWNEKKQKQIDLLQKEEDERNKYPGLPGQSDAEIRDLERQLTLLKAQQETGKNALKDKAESKKIDQEIFDLEQKITKQKIAQVDVNKQANTSELKTAYSKRQGEAVVQGILEAGRALDEKRKDLDTQLKANELRFNRQQGDKYDPYKAPKDESKAEYQARKELNDAVSALRKQEIDEDAAANLEIIQDDKKTLAERVLAYDNYISDRKYQAETERDNSIANARAEIDTVNKLQNNGKAKSQDLINALAFQKQAANTKIIAAQQKYNTDIANIDTQGARQLQGIQKSDVDTRLKAISDIKAAEEQKRDDSLKAARQEYQDGLINYQEYKNKEKEINDKAAVDEAEAVKSYLGSQLDALAGKGVDVTALRAALNTALKQIYDADAKAFDDAEAKKQESIKKTNEYAQKFAEETVKTVQAFVDAGYQKQIQQDEAQIADINTKKDAEISAVNASLASQQQKATQIDIINKQAAAKQAQIQAQERTIKRKQAVADRTAAILGVLENAAVAELGALKAGYAGIPLQILIAGVAAAQTAAIVAQPLPEYWKGTDGKFSALGAAITDERGPELYVGKSGQMYMGSDQGPTLRYFNEPTQIIPHDQVPDVMQLVQQFTRVPRMPHGAQGMDTANLGNKLDKVEKAIRESRSISSMTVTEGGWTHVVQNGGNTLNYEHNLRN